ncbi:Os04g0211700 [Oryza sativa Japonica Group]|uniref:Os04g0211700 protein n=1 Tax=Oryza sativa subsp. japonica TaxID=39947 RepID=Q0JER9_ORYSJ|nr:Os04g0211700 [Oryza sativa Japonica Group]|eukprot:NP_001052254.2 Os04g0211700 [Oryza sativa Japonica Group]
MGSMGSVIESVPQVVESESGRFTLSYVTLAKLKSYVPYAWGLQHIETVLVNVWQLENLQNQREDIMSAGRRAGLEILQLIDEPIAAALSSTTIKEGVVVVFGMGAGSYSVAVLHVSGMNIEMIKLHSVDVRGDKCAMRQLVEVAEQAKVKLSSQPTATISIPYLTSSGQGHGPAHLNITISRQEFEKLVNNLTEQIQEKCQIILKEAKIAAKDVDELVLFGGMTRVPKIQRIIYEVFGKHQSAKVNPEEALVIGSAMQAALIVEDQQEMSKDMIPLSIGIECEEGIFTKVIPRHTRIPTKRMVKIPAWCAQGECLHIRIFLGEHVIVDHNTLLGEVELINNRRSYEGGVDYELTFEVSRNYLVEVSVSNADDGSKTIKAFPIDEKVVCKHNVNRAVRNALRDWSMYAAEIYADMRNLARHTINTLSDALSARKDELPKDLYEDAVTALDDLLKAMGKDVSVLHDKIRAAMSVEVTILNWRPPSKSHPGDYDDYSDYEN